MSDIYHGAARLLEAYEFLADPYRVVLARVIFRFIKPDGACLLWTRGATREGYPRVQLGGRRGRKFYVHRLVFFLFHEVPKDRYLVMDHRCANRRCVYHLEAVDPDTNGVRVVADRMFQEAV